MSVLEEILHSLSETLVEVLGGEMKKQKLEAGDIVKVPRYGGIYYHFAVYIGNNEVIHFSDHDGDWGENITIHRASFDTFLNGETKFYIVNFPEKHSPSSPPSSSGKLPMMGSSIIADDQSWLRRRIRQIEEAEKQRKYKLYSKEETVERAKSRIGESGYNLFHNNCEHFAIWCKTGIAESYQVEGDAQIEKNGGIPFPFPPIIF